MKKTLIISTLLLIGVFIFSGCSTTVDNNDYQEQQRNNLKPTTQKKSEEVLVRQDLKTDIQKIYSDDIKKQKIVYNFAKELEKILIVENFKELNLDSFTRATDCMSFNMLGIDIGLIENLVFNSDEKMKKYTDFNVYQSGKSFGGDLENLDCTFE